MTKVLFDGLGNRVVVPDMVDLFKELEVLKKKNDELLKQREEDSKRLEDIQQRNAELARQIAEKPKKPKKKKD